MKFCKDCKYYKSNLFTFFNHFAECKHPKDKLFDLVTGGYKQRYRFCSVLRIGHTDCCGSKAAWFEPKK